VTARTEAVEIVFRGFEAPRSGESFPVRNIMGTMAPHCSMKAVTLKTHSKRFICLSRGPDLSGQMPC